jgi:hypothetical protein
MLILVEKAEKLLKIAEKVLKIINKQNLKS